MGSELVRRQVLAGVLIFVCLGTGRCLTTDQTVTAPTADSEVFETVSTFAPSSGGHVRTAVHLSPNATTELGVTNSR